MGAVKTHRTCYEMCDYENQCGYIVKYSYAKRCERHEWRELKNTVPTNNHRRLHGLKPIRRVMS